MQELEVVRSAMQEAGQLLQKEAEREGGPRGSGTKAEIDAEIGALLCERIHAAFPQDTIVCEEGGGFVGSSDRAFHVDPHDGTRDFLQGRRETSISVGLVQDGMLLMGVVFAPISVPLLDDRSVLVSWGQGQPICLNGQPISVPPAPKTLSEDSLILISTRIQNEAYSAICEALAPARVVHCGSIATRLALTAIGVADAGFSRGYTLQGWDFAGGQALLQAAGGTLVTAKGDVLEWQNAHPFEATGYFGARSIPFAAQIAERVERIFEREL